MVWHNFSVLCPRSRIGKVTVRQACEKFESGAEPRLWCTLPCAWGLEQGGSLTSTCPSPVQHQAALCVSFGNNLITFLFLNRIIHAIATISCSYCYLGLTVRTATCCCAPAEFDSHICTLCLDHHNMMRNTCKVVNECMLLGAVWLLLAERDESTADNVFLQALLAGVRSTSLSGLHAVSPEVVWSLGVLLITIVGGGLILMLFSKLALGQSQLTSALYVLPELFPRCCCSAPHHCIGQRQAKA